MKRESILSILTSWNGLKVSYREVLIMFKIAFFGTKTYYRPFLEPAFMANGINARFFDIALAPETIFFAKGNDGICA